MDGWMDGGKRTPARQILKVLKFILILTYLPVAVYDGYGIVAFVYCTGAQITLLRGNALVPHPLL